MPPEYVGFRAALVEIARQSKRAWRAVEAEVTEDFLGKRPLFDDEMNQLLPEAHGTAEVEVTIPFGKLPHRIFLLPPLEPDRALRCLLALHWDFSREGGGRGTFRLYILRERGESDRRWQNAFVLRFDDRENAGTGWAYAHCQVCDRPVHYSDLLCMPTIYLPAEVPRIPLPSETISSHTMLLCLLVSLYGTESQLFSAAVRAMIGGDATALSRQLSGK